MCLPDFIEFKNIDESTPMIGYRNWRLPAKGDSLILISESLNYNWDKIIEGPHKVKNSNSGIYAYNNYNYNNYNNYYNYNYYNNYYNYNYNNYNNNYNYYNNNNCNNNNNYNNYNYNYNYYNNYNNYNDNYNYYNNSGVIQQYGKTAVHKNGQRSEYAKIKTLFTIRKQYAQGPREFLGWIDIFNNRIEAVAKRYNAETVNYQDFIESQKGE